MNVKDSILSTGVALLRDKGIAALTQPQVARAAGIKQSHLTYYFPTRAELLLGIAEQSIGTTLATSAARLANPRHYRLHRGAGRIHAAGDLQPRQPRKAGVSRRGDA